MASDVSLPFSTAACQKAQNEEAHHINGLTQPLMTKWWVLVRELTKSCMTDRENENGEKSMTSNTLVTYEKPGFQQVCAMACHHFIWF